VAPGAIPSWRFTKLFGSSDSSAAAPSAAPNAQPGSSA
jgi:hypothetical protein